MKQIDKKGMNKRGELIILSAILLTVIVSIGTAIILNDSQHIYVGDRLNFTVYDYNKCPNEVENIPDNQRVFFGNLKEAMEQNFQEGKGCT